MALKQWESSYCRRKIPKQPRRHSFCIFTEGETEKLYFRDFNLISATVQCLGLGGGSASYLAKEAATQKKTTLYSGYDEYYLVFDCDNNSAEDIQRAIEIAKKSKICWIFSNPCFEIWFVLHFTLFNTPTEAHALKNKHLPKYVEHYHETLPKMYSQLLDRQANAFRHARELLKEWEDWNFKLHRANPSTNVFELAEQMNHFLR